MNWKKNYFTLLQFAFIITGGIAIAFVKKGELELFINQQLTHPFLDVLFKYLTYLGDGFMLLPVFIMLLFIKFRWAAILAITALYQLLIVHINKRILFSGMVRPKAFFEGYHLHFVEGVKVHSYNSFPSGHTATAFAIFYLLALMSGKKSWSIFFFLLSIATGFSRIYLMQHFFIDVYAGSIAGCLATLLAVYTIKKFGNNPFLERKIRI